MWLANYSLDFLMKTLPGYGFKLWIESDTVSRRLEERYEQSLTSLQFDKALPGFGDLLERPPLRLCSFDSGKPGIPPMLVSCGMHPSAPIGRRAIEATTRAQVRTHSGNSPARGWAPKRV